MELYAAERLMILSLVAPGQISRFNDVKCTLILRTRCFDILEFFSMVVYFYGLLVAMCKLKTAGFNRLKTLSGNRNE